MQFWKTIVVVVLLAIVGAYAFYTSRQPAPGSTPKLLSVAPSDIKKIELRSADRDIVVERDGGQWRIVKPVQADADKSAADSIADALANVQITSTVDKPSDLAPFGLAKPVVVVSAYDKDDKALPQITVGRDTPVGNSTYIMAGNKPDILLVANSFPAQVNKSVNDLRSRVLLAMKPEEVRRIVLDEGVGKTLELEKKGSQWMISKPRPYAADNAAVKQLLDALTNARISEFPSNASSDLNEYGLANPSFRVALYGDKNKEESVLFGFKQPQADKDAIYIRRGEGSDRPVATVYQDVFTAADKDFDDLRDKTVLVFNPSDVDRATIAGGPISEVLERGANGKWNIAAEGKSAPAETLVAESLLDQLHDLKATKIPEDPMTDAKRYGMVTPTLNITLYAKDGKEIGAVRVSAIAETMTPHETLASEPKPKPQTRYFGYAT
ncbi:MAG TPA: DUF4340 domain-containing protein, partial [Candidatus Binataceae bacterium]|nr:DUF4340 domain-containing protein [Candidatus Binataceae bacterium]